MTATLEHANICVSDPHKTAAWMEKIFGWRIRWEGPALNGGYSVHVGSKDSYLALYAPKDLPEEVFVKWQEVLGQVATDEKWLELASRRGSISTIGTVDMTDYAKSQYELFNGLAKDFGYLPN